VRAAKQLIGRILGRVWPLRVQRGPCQGMRLYGNVFYNRLPAEFREEEKFYSGLDLTGKTVVEAGAHIGVFTYLFSQTADSVVAFEPNPETFKTAARNVRVNGLSNVRLINAGLSSGAGKANYVAERFVSARGSLKEDIQSGIRDRSRHLVQAEVELLSVDEVMRDSPVDFVKIDTEGFETMVLSGMGDTIKRYKPDIYFEVHGVTDEDKAADLRAIQDVLSPAGYEIRRLSSGLPAADPGSAKGGYIAFVEMTAYLDAALQPFQQISP
jgi:FkbM family methyltransferase